MRLASPLEEFTDVDRGAMIVEEALQKNGEGEEAAAEEQVDEGSAFVDEVDHGRESGGRAIWVVPNPDFRNGDDSGEVLGGQLEKRRLIGDGDAEPSVGNQLFSG